MVKAHAPTKACASAIEQGRAVILGGFTKHEVPFYVVEVNTEHGNHYYMRVDVDENGRRYAVQRFYDRCFMWEHWNGTLGGKRPLIDGDQHKPEWKELYAQRTPQTPAAS